MFERLKQRLGKTTKIYRFGKFIFPRPTPIKEWEDAPYKEEPRISLIFRFNLENNDGTTPFAGIEAFVTLEVGSDSIGYATPSSLPIRDREEIAKEVRTLLGLPIYDVTATPEKQSEI